jgi:hypothetical protein
LAIEAIELPTSCPELDTALNIMGYTRKFILNYASITEPLRRKRAGKPHPWHKVNGAVPWMEEEKTAFFKLRDALKGPSILQHPYWAHPFELHTDASHHGLGAVLCQRVKGAQRVIAYASRSVSKTEAPYSTWELEALAMIWATHLFRIYLTGTKFRIITDSRAAKAFIEASDDTAGGLLLRWRLALSEFDFDVVHRDGAKSGNANCLSRLPLDSTEPYGEGQTDLLHLLHIDCNGEAAEMVEAWTTTEWAIHEFEDPRTGTLITKLRANDELTSRRYELHVDTDSKVSLLYKKEQRPGHPIRYPLCVPPNLRAFILRRSHTLPVSGHKGRDKTVAAIARLYF